MSSWAIFWDSDGQLSPWAVNTHASSSLVLAFDTSQLVSRPNTKNSTDCEIGINDARTIKGIESTTESTRLVIPKLVRISRKITNLRSLL